MRDSEYVAGADPTDPASSLSVKATPSQSVGGELLLEWRSHPSRVYAVEWSPDPPTTFTTLQGNLLADPSGKNTFIWNTQTRPAGFLRVRVERLSGF